MTTSEWATDPGTYLVVAGAAAAATLAGTAFILQSKHPVAGLTLLLLTGVLVPLEFSLGPSTLNSCLFVAAFLCGSFALSMTTSRRRVVLDDSRTVLAILAFILVAFMSFVVGQYPWFAAAQAPMAAQVTGLGLFVLSGGLFLVVAHQVVTIRQLKWLTWSFLASGAIAVLASVVPGFDFDVGPITVSNTSSIGSAFWTWIVAMSLGQAVVNRDLSPPMRIAVGGLAAAALARGLLTAFSWTSGWLPPLVAGGTVLLCRFPRLTLASCLVAAAPVFLLGGPALNAWMAEESYSSMTRVEAFRVMWRIIEREPWLGFGPANIFHYTALFPIMGWWVKFNSHNNYVDIVGQVGFIGLAAFGWFVVEVARLALRLRHRLTTGFERAYVVAAAAGLTGSLVSGLLADWIVPFIYNVGVRGFRSSVLFWFFLGGVLSLKRIESERARSRGGSYTELQVDEEIQDLKSSFRQAW